MILPRKLTDIQIKILKVLYNTKGVYGSAGMSTYEICRMLNNVKNRNFCHAHRTYKTRESGRFKGAQNPTVGCSNDVLGCCKIPLSKVKSALKALESKNLIFSRVVRATDIKRMRTFVQISKDYYRMWFLK